VVDDVEPEELATIGAVGFCLLIDVNYDNNVMLTESITQEVKIIIMITILNLNDLQ
jgi:hypothetical protein